MIPQHSRRPTTTDDFQLSFQIRRYSIPARGCVSHRCDTCQSEPQGYFGTNWRRSCLKVMTLWYFDSNDESLLTYQMVNNSQIIPRHRQHSLDEDAVRPLLLLYNQHVKIAPPPSHFSVILRIVFESFLLLLQICPSIASCRHHSLKKCRCGPGDLHHSLILTGDI